MKYDISVREFLEDSKNGNINYKDFVAEYLDELKDKNKKLRFMHVTAGGSRTRNTPHASLYGLPVTAKDAICTKGMQSSAGSKILDGYIPPFDATSVARLREQSAFIAGKTNQDEFGFGSFSTNSAYGVPKNPFDPHRTAGGSSGGAAVAIASVKFPQIALAESTGGSISCPAAWCNVTSITPTYGLVSRYGLIDYANSLDKIGVMGKEVYDVALGLSLIAGKDPKDATSCGTRKTYGKLNTDLKGMKIAVPKEYFEGVSPKVSKDVWKAIKLLESHGAKYKEVKLTTTKYSIAAYYIIAMSEASTNLSRYCGMRYGLHQQLSGSFDEYFSGVRSFGFGEEAKRRIMLGTFARMSGYREQYYMKAMRVRTLIIQEFKSIFKNFDVIAGPTMPTIAPRFSDIEKLSPVKAYHMDALTVPHNLAGMPGVNVPCGNMIGLHLIGDHLQEQKLLNVAAGYEVVR